MTVLPNTVEGEEGELLFPLRDSVLCTTIQLREELAREGGASPHSLAEGCSGKWQVMTAHRDITPPAVHTTTTDSISIVGSVTEENKVCT